MKGRPPRQGATNARLAIRQAIQAIKPPRRTRPAATAPRVPPAASPIPPLTRSDALSDLASDTTQCMSNSSFLSDLQQSSSSSSVLLAAVSDVVTNNTSIRRAAVVHGCPRTTLHRAVQAHKYVCVLNVLWFTFGSRVVLSLVPCGRIRAHCTRTWRAMGPLRTVGRCPLSYSCIHWV